MKKWWKKTWSKINEAINDFFAWCDRHNIDIGPIEVSSSHGFGPGGEDGHGGEPTSPYEDMHPNPFGNQYVYDPFFDPIIYPSMAPAYPIAPQASSLGPVAGNIGNTFGPVSSVETPGTPLVATPSGEALSPCIVERTPGVGLIDNISVFALGVKAAASKGLSNAGNITKDITVSSSRAGSKGLSYTSTTLKSIKPYKLIKHGARALTLAISGCEIINTFRDKNLSTAEKFGMSAAIAGGVALTYGVGVASSYINPVAGVVAAGITGFVVEYRKQRLYSWMRRN